MPQVGILGKVRFSAEADYGDGPDGADQDFACDSISGEGPNRARLDKGKIAGAYGTQYSFPGKISFQRTYVIEMNDDNDTWLNTACVNRTLNVQASYAIDEYDPGGQYYIAYGCKCAGLTISWEDESDVIASMEWIGNGNIQGLAAADGLGTFTPDDYITNIPYMIPTFSIDGQTTFNVTSYTATISNNLIVGPINTSYYAKSLTEGAQKYEFTVTMENDADTRFIDKSLGGTSVTCTVTNSDGTNTQTLTFSDCLITSPAVDSVDAESITALDVTFTPTGDSGFNWANGG